MFAIFIAANLHLISEELPQGIPIMYRTDGRLFNLNRFKAKSKVNCTTITELQYTDDNVIAAHSAEDLWGILNAFAKAYRALGLSPCLPHPVWSSRRKSVKDGAANH